MSDVNTPSAESLVRQVLYGKQVFRRELGKTSAEYMLPDCFGFPASLPSILAHAGIKGFSTQKLTWKSAAPVGGPGSPERTPVGIPFNVGVWTGPDGRGVIAAFNPLSYGGDVRHDLSKSPPPAPKDARPVPVDWPERVRRKGEVGGLFADYHYYGTGDIGGSPREPSVRLMEAILTRGKTVLPSPSAGPRFSPQEPPPSGPEVQVGDGPLRVVQVSAEQMFLDITPEQAAKLPRYEGDLLLTGTSIPKAYEYSWNDEVLALNQFAGVLTSATEAIVSGLDTRAAGTAVVVYNPLNVDVGTVRRGNNDPRKYEVPSHQWFDLTDRSGSHGVTVLSDCKYGSDKPADDTLRLTLIYSPGIGEGNGRGYSDQATQDWGHHELVYGLAGHAGDFRREQTDWQGQRLNQPLLAFVSPSHPGPLGRTFSLLGASTSRVRVLALKRAEQGDEFVVRLVELDGRKAPGVRLTFAGPLAAAREVNGAEEPVGLATLARGELVTDLGPFQLRTFAVKLAPSRARVAAPRSREVPLPHERSVASLDGTRSGGGFDAAGRSLPAEMLPGRITFGGISFSLAPAGAAKPDATVARGQTIPLPAGRNRRVHLLAASAEGDQKVTLRVGDTPVDLVIQDWGGYVGQWDNRTWATHEEPMPPRPGMPAPRPGTPPRMRTLLDCRGLVPGYVKRAPVAWFASHRHTAEGANEPYSYAYLYDHAVEVPDLVRTLTLPENDKVRVLAVTVAEEGEPLRPAQPLYDTLPR